MSEETQAESSGKTTVSADQQFAAHTPNAGGQWQWLEDHLLGVAETAGQFAAPFGAHELAFRAGLLHDVGKYSDEFQEYLRRCYEAKRTGRAAPQKGVDHKSAGARCAHEDRRGGVGGLLAYPLFGHHGGLPCRAELQDALKKAQNPAGDLA